MDNFYDWGGEMETHDWGDYESYDTEVTSISFSRMAEQMDPAIKYNIDQQYRTNPELRDEILQSLEDEEDEGGYDLNPEVGSPTLDVPPRKIAQKFSDVNGYGEIKFDMQGGKGIAYFTDKNLVIKGPKKNAILFEKEQIKYYKKNIECNCGNNPCICDE